MLGPNELRLECLRLACGHFSGKDAAPENVVATAKMFIDFTTGPSPTGKPVLQDLSKAS